MLVCSESKMACNGTAAFLSSEALSERASQLISIMEAAHSLRDSKDADRAKLNGKVGLGNGKKRSKRYEQFVLTKRATLKQEMNICEHVTQKLLGYSNNFLHKRLVTEKQRTRLSGLPKAPLVDVTSLWREKCCRDHCVRLSRSHLNLVVKWQQLSQESQRGLHQAIAELLIPTAGAKTNCYKFISMVTGCSPSTIAKVSKKLQTNGGVLGPQEHGLRRYWRLKREESGEQEVDDGGDYDLPTVWSLPRHHPDEIVLQQRLATQSRQLESLKSKVKEQQIELERRRVLLSQSVPQPPHRHLPSSTISSPQYPIQSSQPRLHSTFPRPHTASPHNIAPHAAAPHAAAPHAAAPHATIAQPASAVRPSTQLLVDGSNILRQSAPISGPSCSHVTVSDSHRFVASQHDTSNLPALPPDSRSMYSNNTGRVLLAACSSRVEQGGAWLGTSTDMTDGSPHVWTSPPILHASSCHRLLDDM